MRMSRPRAVLPALGLAAVLLLAVLYLGAAGSPAEITDYSAGYTLAASYEITGDSLDLQAMDSYPQRIVDFPAPGDGPAVITVLVNNQSYADVPAVPIDRHVYPKTVRPYLEESEKVAWTGDATAALLASVTAQDVMNYAQLAALRVFQALSYDEELAEDITDGESDTLSAEEALQRGSGTCGEYTNLLLALLRGRGIPARFITGLIYDPESPRGFRTFHAWAEFYLQGYGWIPVDATRGRVGIPDEYLKLYVGRDFPDIGIPLSGISVSQVRRLNP